MTLKELIETLEKAKELATDGEWHGPLPGDDNLIYHAVTQTVIGGSHEGGLAYMAEQCTKGNAQAIAIQHNAGPDVLRELSRISGLESEFAEWKESSAYWQGFANKMKDERCEWKDRAVAAEGELERMKSDAESRSKAESDEYEVQEYCAGIYERLSNPDSNYGTILTDERRAKMIAYLHEHGRTWPLPGNDGKEWDVSP